MKSPAVPVEKAVPVTPVASKGKGEVGETPLDWSAGSKPSFVHDTELADEELAEVRRISRETSGDATVTSASEVPSSDVVMGASSGGSGSEEAARNRGIGYSARSRSPPPTETGEVSEPMASETKEPEVEEFDPTKHNIYKGSKITAFTLAIAPPIAQKQILGEALFPHVRELFADDASRKVVGHLLTLENTVITNMLEDRGVLRWQCDQVAGRLGVRGQEAPALDAGRGWIGPELPQERGDNSRRTLSAPPGYHREV